MPKIQRKITFRQKGVERCESCKGKGKQNYGGLLKDDCVICYGHGQHFVYGKFEDDEEVGTLESSWKLTIDGSIHLVGKKLTLMAVMRDCWVDPKTSKPMLSHITGNKENGYVLTDEYGKVIDKNQFYENLMKGYLWKDGN